MRPIATLTMVAAAVGFAAQFDFARAQETYPSRPVEIVVPFAAGAATDLLARLVAEELQSQFGQPFVVLVKPGAGGQIGTEYVAEATPDGYTLLVSTVALTSSPFVSKTFTLHPVDDLTHIAPLAAGPNLLLVNPALGVSTAEEFVAYAKEHPGELNIGFWAPSVEMNIRLLEEAAGIELMPIPYQGGAAAITALLSHETQALLSTYQGVREYVQAGSLNALGVGTLSPYSLAPDIPLLTDAGVPGYRASLTWFGISGPAGMPRDIIDTLNVAINRALTEPKVVEFINGSLFYDVVASDVDTFQQFVKDDYEWFAQAAAVAGIEPK